MWNGGTGQYPRPQQSGQPLHATWSSGVNAARPRQQQAPANNALGGVGYLDPHIHSQRPPAPHGTPPSKGGAASDGLPDAPTSFPELERMDLKQLQLLQDEKAKFDDFVSKHGYQREVDAFVATVRADVEKFQREHDLITQKMGEMVDESGLEELKARIAEMEEEVQGLEKLKEEWMENNSPERLMERLKIAIAESETRSDGLQKRMLSSSINFDEFLQEYIECRRVLHERAAKLEHLKQESRKRTMSVAR